MKNSFKHGYPGRNSGWEAGEVEVGSVVWHRVQEREKKAISEKSDREFAQKEYLIAKARQAIVSFLKNPELTEKPEIKEKFTELTWDLSDRALERLGRGNDEQTHEMLTKMLEDYEYAKNEIESSDLMDKKTKTEVLNEAKGAIQTGFSDGYADFLVKRGELSCPKERFEKLWNELLRELEINPDDVNLNVKIEFMKSQIPGFENQRDKMHDTYRKFGNPNLKVNSNAYYKDFAKVIKKILLRSNLKYDLANFKNLAKKLQPEILPSENITSKTTTVKKRIPLEKKGKGGLFNYFKKFFK